MNADRLEEIRRRATALGPEAAALVDELARDNAHLRARIQLRNEFALIVSAERDEAFYGRQEAVRQAFESGRFKGRQEVWDARAEAAPRGRKRR